MKRKKPAERPDKEYWEASPKRKLSFDESKLAEIIIDLARYSRERFVLGRRFKLSRNFFGYPKGSTCTVVSTWPQTKVCWDKRRNLESVVTSVNFELDGLLEAVD